MLLLLLLLLVLLCNCFVSVILVCDTLAHATTLTDGMSALYVRLIHLPYTYAL